MKIVILTNILSPYRRYLFDRLNEELEKNGDVLKVLLMSNTEPSRPWIYDDYKTDYTVLLKSKTIMIGKHFFHINKDLKKVLKDIQPDILIAAGSYTFPSVWKAISLKRLLNYKILFWSESHLDEQRNTTKLVLLIRNTIRKIIYRRFDGFWYAGKKSKEFILNYCKSTAKFFFVPNLVDKDVFSKSKLISNDEKNDIKRSINIDSNKKVLIIPARLIEVKGIIPFFEKLNIGRYLHNIVFVICGDGDQKDRISEIAKQKNIDIRLLGYQEPEELLKYYSISDVFLLPSLSDANPLTCVEALWSGLVIYISRNVGNYPEVVLEGINGYTFSNSDSNEMNSKLIKIIEADCQWYENAKEKSIEIAESVYNPNKSMYKLADGIRKEFANVINEAK